MFVEAMHDRELHSPESIRRIRRVEFLQMVEHGLFADEHIELIRGELVVMSPQGEDHTNVTAELMTFLVKQLGDDYRVRPHSSLPLPAWDDSVPEPDLVVVTRTNDWSAPRGAHLVVEVADSSLRKDSIVKAVLYAEAEIPVYWLIDVRHQVVLIHTCPAHGRYEHVERKGRGDVLRVAQLPTVAVPVDDILPPR